MTDLVRIYPSLLRMFKEDSLFIYWDLTEISTVLAIKAFDFALHHLNVVIQLCQVRDVQYDQVATAIEDLQSNLKREYINDRSWSGTRPELTLLPSGVRGARCSGRETSWAGRWGTEYTISSLQTPIAIMCS